MIDIQIVRDNPQLVAEKSRQKGYEIDVDQLLGFDSKRREMQGSVDALRQQRNEIAARMKGQRPSDEAIAQGKAIKDQLADIEHQLTSIEKEFVELLNRVPNLTFDDVPLGGEEDSVEVKQWGGQPTGAKDHL